jgi:hypothetical protein
VGTMAEVVQTEDPPVRRRVFPDVKKVGQKSAVGTKKAMQATMDMPVAAAKATKGAATAFAKAFKFKKREAIIEDELESLLIGAGRTQEFSLASPSWDSDVLDDSPIDNNEASVASPSTGSPLAIVPILDFLSADATVILILSLSVAIASTLRNWQSVFDNQIPLSVAGSWALLTYALGRVFPVPKLKTSHSVLPISRASSYISESSLHSRNPSEVVDTPRNLSVKVKEEKADTHRFFLKIFGRKEPHERIKAKTVPESAPKPRKSWTNLQPNRVKVHRWERRYDPTKDPKRPSDLMQRLSTNKSFRRTVRPDTLQEEHPGMDILPCPTSTSLGAFDRSEATADSLDDFVIEPILKLRGMDVFLADQLESHVASHPWLISQGLRNVPTLIVNTVTQWGHILVYFEMPAWVQDWNNIVEDECDADDVKALKRFLNGDSEYRNERLKVIPSIVEGPLAVKILAPPRKEVRLDCASLPVTWQQYDPETTSKGQKLCPALEVTLDCVSARPMRTMAGIIKRNMKYLSIDIAVVIGQPKDKEEDELLACLGLWRMDHVDISACPHFPDQLATEASRTGRDPDVLRATKLVKMTDLEYQELAAQ